MTQNLTVPIINEANGLHLRCVYTDSDAFTCIRCSEMIKYFKILLFLLYFSSNKCSP